MTKRSFFERLTGSHPDDEDSRGESSASSPFPINRNIMEEIEGENEEGQLAVDVYQTPTEIIIQAVTAGVPINDLDVDLTHEMVTIRGKREHKRTIDKEDFFYQEVYWGSFSRSILLPQEVDPDEAEATMKDGILTVKLPKLDKERVQKLKVKND